TPRAAEGSACTVLDDICGIIAKGGAGFSGIEKFEAGIPADWAVFELGSIPSGGNNWTTTDDTDYTDADGSGCGGAAANWPGGNTTAGSGAAACADSDGSVEANGPDIEPDGTPDCGTAVPDDPTSDCQMRAYMCVPPINPADYTNSTLSFNVDYQTASQDSAAAGDPPQEALQLLVGTAAPSALTINTYDGPFVFDHKSGSLEISPSRVLSLNLNSFVDPALTDPDPALDGPINVCFHYAGVFSWYAQIDNVALRAENCAVGDADFDGVSDDVDNCTDVANPGQEDSNGDGIGNICDADLTGFGGLEDCIVNFLDLTAMKSAFFSADADADLDSSGFVNFADLTIMKNQFFGPPGPSATGCN
ncbi:MAG: hypothetical protein KJO55_02010, partial [Gammaproteobacteria bacterium]|nr:hypothetical protein [Gammaproteobacteria bacterium]